jgi:glutamate racemase
MRVGIFDSGVGGLSILSAVTKALPGLDVVYCCDNLNFPYGTKSEFEVLRLALEITEKFIVRANIDVLVIACNTVSTIALAALRAKISIPIVGVVPAVKPAAQASISKIIGILATPSAIRQPYLSTLIDEFANGCEVVKCGPSGLAGLAEQKMRGVAITDEDILEQIPEIVEAARRGLDQLVLGCTHFPLLATEFRRVLPPSVHLVDSGEAVANRVKAILHELDGLPPSSAINDVEGWCSGPSFSVVLPESLAGNQRDLLVKSFSV